MSTYTFNYCYHVDDNVDGKLLKKTLLVRSTCLINRLAPKIGNFPTNESQAGVFAPVKTDKSERSNLTGSLVLDKTCRVSLGIVFFIKRINKI
jgi:hypothetical protein